MKTLYSALLVFFLVGVSVARAQDKSPIQTFAAGLDSIRTALKIPGLAAALMTGDSVIFDNGFGYADLLNQIPVTPSTTFRVASITKTFTSTIIMQLVEQGTLDLQTPISKYGLDFGNPNIRVKHLLTNTSDGEPGAHFQYNGYRFGRLGIVIEKTGGTPFFQLLMERIVKPLGMSSTAPGISLFSYFNYVKEKQDMKPFFEKAFTSLAKPYEHDAAGKVLETRYLDEFGAFGGLTTSTGDLLKYSAAIDRNLFLKEQTQKLVFTPNRTNNGATTPYGLGWFSQQYRGDWYYWHYGQTHGESGLFVKVPSRKLTLVVLTNIDKLSQPFPLGDGDLFTSPVGQLFYKCFIDTAKSFRVIDFSQPVAAIATTITTDRMDGHTEFYNKEIISQASMNNIKGDSVKARDLYRLYGELNFKGRNPAGNGKPLAIIKEMGINAERTVQFAISNKKPVRIFGVGENCSSDFSSWCDYGWIEDSRGKIVWQMQGQAAKHAGGAIKNQLVDTLITLPAGSYKLRYKSDGGHAFNQWDSAPPDFFFWGISVTSETTR